MKSSLILFACLGGAVILPAQPAPVPAAVAPADNPADADYTAIQQLMREHPPGPPQEMGAASYLTWVDTHRQAVTAQILVFHEKHPADPRRWDLVFRMNDNQPLFAKGFGPDVEEKGAAAAVVDEPAKAAWEKKLAELKAALLASTDAAPAVREWAEWGQFASDFRATTQARAKGEKRDYDGFRARFDAHVAKYAALDIVADRAADYLGALERNVPGTTAAIWQELLTAPNAALRAKAAERLRFLALVSKPLDLAFTAADGRPVDLKALRGQVVLVDFWATWCGPCKAELPNVKKVYAAYHDKGFAVVGISLENAGLTPKDTPEETAAKLTKAEAVLTGFTAQEAMPWPQYFDGKFWKNDISTKYAITSIPAMFLLDQDGKVVSTNARGPKLEAEVKRLLKL